MKKVFILILIAGLFSCQNNKKEQKKETHTQKNVSKQSLWKLDADHSLIQWTAYKTTSRVPVKGEFKQFDLKGVQTAENIPNTLKNAEIDINIFSVFTNVEERDKKIILYLFEKMSNTNKIKVKVKKIEGNTLYADITMNGRTKEVPFNMHVDEKRGTLDLTGKIDLVKDFEAQKPLSLLNKACYNLHMGEDGVSKTWPDVNLRAFLKYHKE